MVTVKNNNSLINRFIRNNMQSEISFVCLNRKLYFPSLVSFIKKMDIIIKNTDYTIKEF